MEQKQNKNYHGSSTKSTSIKFRNSRRSHPISIWTNLRPKCQHETTDTPLGGAISIVSIILAGLGFLPSIVFLIGAMKSYSFHFGHLAFFFVGFIIHGTGALVGLTALTMGVKIRGIIGLAGNALEIFIAIIGLTRSLDVMFRKLDTVIVPCLDKSDTRATRQFHFFLNSALTTRRPISPLPRDALRLPARQHRPMDERSLAPHPLGPDTPIKFLGP